MYVFEPTIFARFKRLGLSDHEIRVYLSLLKHESSSGYQLSKNSNVPTSKIYQVIKKLLGEGLIIATDSRPVKYAACPPEDVVRKLSADFSACISDLNRNLKLFTRKTPVQDHLAWNIIGRESILSKAKECISASKDAVFIAAWQNELKSLRTLLIGAEKRGVRIKIVCYGKTTITSGIIYSHRPTDYPYRERGERRFTLAVDNEIAVIANLSKTSSSGLHTKNYGLVHLIRDFIIHEIYIILVENALPKEVSDVVGRDWEKVRIGR
jgi:HTH-type transcriptional regulator, sugar sensing transcriptional regulator